jgi:leader peptidase (prepilin peptidase)/N-methyltransferase
MNLFIIVAAFVFGAVIGSFLNVVIWRLPRGDSLGGRSRCPHCRQTLRPVDLVPVLSYFWRRGRCAYCRKSISPRYVIIEGVTGLLFGLTAAHVLRSGITPISVVELLRLLFIIAILIAVFVIDLEHYLILDAIILPASVIVLVFNIALDLVSRHSVTSLSSHTIGGIVAAALASGLFYLLWRTSRGRWMGFGDVKFNIFLGLALGLPGIGVGLFVAFMLGAVTGLGLIALRFKQLQSRVPFGTFLSLAALLTIFYGPWLAAWYARLIGWR